MVKFIYSEKFRWSFFSFFLIGLLAWDRPELGIFLLLFLLVAYIPSVIRQYKKMRIIRNIGYLLISPIFTAFGAIPMFINNFLITKSPFIPVQSIWITGSVYNISGNISVIQSGSDTIVGNLTIVYQYFFSQINPNFNTLFQNLIGILFLPKIGTTGVFILVPMFVVGVISIPMLFKYRRNSLLSEEMNLIIPLGLMTLSFFVAYVSYYPILNGDPGVAPDVRYLSPIYITLNLIGLIILSKFPGFIQNIPKILKYFLGFTIILIPIFSVIILNTTHKSEFYFVFFDVSFWLSLLMIITIIGFIFLPYLYLQKQSEKRPFNVIIGLLIALPFVWQMFTYFLIANISNSFAGYTFWLPFVVHFNHYLYVLSNLR